MKCQQICLNRQGKGAASTKGESSNEPQAETAHCTRINSKKIRECWDVSKMRCWNSYDGGNLIYDNRHEWLLLRHWQGEFERSSNVNIQWMDLRSACDRFWTSDEISIHSQNARSRFHGPQRRL